MSVFIKLNQWFLCCSLQVRSSKFEGLLTAILGYVILAFSLIMFHVSFDSRSIVYFYIHRFVYLWALGTLSVHWLYNFWKCYCFCRLWCSLKSVKCNLRWLMRDKMSFLNDKCSGRVASMVKAISVFVVLMNQLIVLSIIIMLGKERGKLLV